jgi:hypothetical protein
MREAELLYALAVLLYLYECIIVVPLDAYVVGTSGLKLPRSRTVWRRRRPLVLRSGAGPALVLGDVFALGLTMVAAQAKPLVEAGDDRGRAVVPAAVPLSVSGAMTGAGRIGSFAKVTRELRFTQAVLLLAIVVGGALLVWSEVPSTPIFATVVGLWAALVPLSLGVRRRIIPARRPLWRPLVFAWLSPLSAIRLHDHLGRNLVNDVDGLALSGQVRAEGFGDELRTALARAVHLQDGDVLTLANLALAHELDPEALLAPPVAASDDAVAFCPVCLAQFSRLDAVCEADRDLAVVAFGTTR